MESSIEVSQPGGISNPKPSLAPKPRLTPKPFSLQKNTTIRSIHAPKTTSKATTQQTGKPEAKGPPKPTVTAPAQKLPQPAATSDSKPSTLIKVPTKDQPKTTKASGEDTPDSGVGKSAPASQTAPPKETPKATLIQKEDVIQANHKAPADIVTKPEQKEEKKKEDVVQNLEESAENPARQWGGSRKRLSMELTSKFESAGLSVPPQPTVTTSKTSTKDHTNKPEPSDPEPSKPTPEPSNRESDEAAQKEEYTGGGSIKRRISLLFDSSSRPDPITKREEPEVINGTEGVKGVKERIKNWATETITEDPKTERKPQVAPRPRSKR